MEQILATLYCLRRAYPHLKELNPFLPKTSTITELQRKETLAQRPPKTQILVSRQSPTKIVIQKKSRAIIGLVMHLIH